MTLDIEVLERDLSESFFSVNSQRNPPVLSDRCLKDSIFEPPPSAMITAKYQILNSTLGPDYLAMSAITLLQG